MRPTLFNIPLTWLHDWFNWIPSEIAIRGYGLMLMIGFLGGTWWAGRRALRVKADPDFVVNLGFIALLSSIAGARIFYVMHYWDQHFAGKGLWAVVNVTAGGLEFYGGFIGALVAGIPYLLWRRVSIRLYLDIIAPSVMFGMSMARIGCFLNGCCWGAPCTHDLPWAVRFPYGSPAHQREWSERQVTIPAELLYLSVSGDAYPLPPDWLEAANQPNSKKAAAGVAQLNTLARRFNLTPAQLQQEAASGGNKSLRLHPVQLYASIDGILLATLLNVYFYRRRRHGTVFAMLLLLYPAMRIVEEIIRSDNPHDTAGLTISQFVSVMLLLCGVAMLLWIRRQPPRSPRAVAYVPPWTQPQPEPAMPGRSKKRK